MWLDRVCERRGRYRYYDNTEVTLNYAHNVREGCQEERALELKGACCSLAEQREVRACLTERRNVKCPKMRMRPAHAGAGAHSQNLNVGVDSVEGDGKRQMGVKSLGALF